MLKAVVRVLSIFCTVCHNFSDQCLHQTPQACLESPASAGAMFPSPPSTCKEVPATMVHITSLHALRGYLATAAQLQASTV